MSDPYLNCDLCGDQCACRAFREEHDHYKEALETVRKWALGPHLSVAAVPLITLVNDVLGEEKSP